MTPPLPGRANDRFVGPPVFFIEEGLKAVKMAVRVWCEECDTKATIPVKSSVRMTAVLATLLKMGWRYDEPEMICPCCVEHGRTEYDSGPEYGDDDDGPDYHTSGIN